MSVCSRWGLRIFDQPNSTDELGSLVGSTHSAKRNILDTTRMKTGFVDTAVGNHDAERAGVIVVMALFGNLLASIILG